jgi:oxalate---CoA ligase
MDNFIRLIEANRSDRIAVAGPDRAAIGFAALGRQIGECRRWFNARGIGRADRIAIVLPNCAEAATAFLAVAGAAGAAPLNPAYRAEEYEFYLDDLEARALILEAGADNAARAVARRRGIAIIELTPDPKAAGRFTLEGDGPGGSAEGGEPSPEDVALYLHTSGTTSRPKLVPLLQRNLRASVGNIGRALALTPEDRCLNIMPLFHIHGLIGVTAAALGNGGSVYYPPGFNALKFFAWLADANPTWYSAVPTMHQAILARAAHNAAALGRHRLRIIRSSSSSLPPQVMAELERNFGCPVIESYGMTEACHQMTSNPLPPAERRPGTVGVAAGPEVAIMGENGRILSPGAVGEVVIRGANVMPGYVNNPKANASGFTAGWFRTGDQGLLDGEGYLTITGRLKEIINRGGEKISPREVDEVLMDHPAVLQAVTFALPHEKLGEEVAAAVVLREGQAATDRELRDFAATRLADFKVPRRILLLPEIPKGATGKLQRIGLAEKLGLAPARSAT